MTLVYVSDMKVPYWEGQLFKKGERLSCNDKQSSFLGDMFR